jgi:hypothetical protein
MNSMLKKLGLALFAFMATSAAYALNLDPNKAIPARDLDIQALHYCRVTVNFNDPRISTGQPFCAVPNNSYIYAIDAQVVTAFNAGTTNTLTLGVTAASANEVVASGVTAGSAAMYHLTSAAGLGVQVTGNATYQSSNGVTLYAKYAQTGTAATTGQVVFLITFAPNNDQ